MIFPQIVRILSETVILDIFLKFQNCAKIFCILYLPLNNSMVQFFQNRQNLPKKICLMYKNYKYNKVKIWYVYIEKQKFDKVWQPYAKRRFYYLILIFEQNEFERITLINKQKWSFILIFLSHFTAHLLVTFVQKLKKDQSFILLHLKFRNLFSKFLFNLLEVFNIILCHNWNSFTLFTDSSRSTNPMYIILRTTKIIIYDKSDIRNIDTSGGNISTDQNSAFTTFKIL